MATLYQISASSCQSLQQFSKRRGWAKGPKCGRPHSQFGRGIQNFYDFLTFADGGGGGVGLSGILCGLPICMFPIAQIFEDTCYVLWNTKLCGWIKINFNIFSEQFRGRISE